MQKSEGRKNMKSEDKVVIQISAEYTDNVTGKLQKSSESADQYCESIKN